jgi:hypothetical protein
MTERDREKDPLTEEIIAPGGVGGPVIVPDEDIDEETPAEHFFHEEEPGESPEDDDELLSGRSPEFEHLTKPKHEPK